jgi:methionyl-tRNA formyltransferase
MKPLAITVLVDSPDSFMMPYVRELIRDLEALKHSVRLIHHHDEMRPGDLAFFLGYYRVVPERVLALHKHNLVVHESAPPQGKGWSPLAWQILEGKNRIPIALLEAVNGIDAGPVYFQETMTFEGHELVGELREAQGRKSLELCLRFVRAYPDVRGREQTGPESFYPRRTPEDSRVDPSRTLVELFDRFRVADNERYPVFFEHRGFRYALRIEKAGTAGSGSAARKRRSTT